MRSTYLNLFFKSCLKSVLTLSCDATCPPGPPPLTRKQKPQEGQGFLSFLFPALSPGPNTVPGTQEILNPYLLNYTKGTKEKKGYDHYLFGAAVHIKQRTAPATTGLSFYRDLG